MTSQADPNHTSTKRSNHMWSSEAVHDAVTKSSKTVKLVSAQDEVVVSVHKELLCFFSPYYTAALKGNFVEAQKDQFEVDLSGKQLESFAAWIYTGKLKVLTTTNYIALYILADQVDIMALRRDTVSDISRREAVFLEYAEVRVVLKNVTQQSQLYRWMLNTYIAHWDTSSDDEDPCVIDSDTDPDHLLANSIYKVMSGVAARGKKKSPYECPCCDDPCQYHEHESRAEWDAICGQDESLDCPIYLD
ncbi:hypothetical protein E4T44_07004 [Aureobasidium sp. EXF-8845]|nr:hypothetical protein E4T44_07004 [Aureobasidium sp. EXF-8845]KAI4855556.1 hypothetical protein E4T45_03000 [Aureobasidium sp. EXF-8846]